MPILFIVGLENSVVFFLFFLLKLVLEIRKEMEIKTTFAVGSLSQLNLLIHEIRHSKSLPWVTDFRATFLCGNLTFLISFQMRETNTSRILGKKLVQKTFCERTRKRFLKPGNFFSFTF